MRLFLLCAVSAIACVASGCSNTSDEIEALVVASLESWESGDEAVFLSTAHPDLLFAFPGERTDAAGALDVFRYWQANFEDTRVYVNWVLVDGDRFAAEYQFATTKISNGRRTAVGTVAIGRVQDGKIILLKEYTDGRASRLQEAGDLPLDEGETPFPWPMTDLVNPWSE